MSKLLLLIIAALLRGGDYSLDSQNTAEPRTFSNIFKEAKAFSVSPAGMIYVLDRGTNEVLKISSEGKILARTGGYGWSKTTFDLPADINSPSDIRTYISDYGTHRIVYFDGNLNFLSFIRLHEGDDLNNRFGYPKSSAIDRFGSLYIVDGENTRVVKIGEKNTIELTFGGVEGGKGRLINPGRIRIGSDDAVYVQDGKGINVYDIYGNYVRKVPFPDSSHFKTFTVNDSDLFVLDSAGVRCISATMDTSISFEAASHAIDLAISNGKIYFLTSTGLIIQPLDTVWLNRSKE